MTSRKLTIDLIPAFARFQGRMSRVRTASIASINALRMGLPSEYGKPVAFFSFELISEGVSGSELVKLCESWVLGNALQEAIESYSALAFEMLKLLKIVDDAKSSQGIVVPSGGDPVQFLETRAESLAARWSKQGLDQKLRELAQLGVRVKWKDEILSINRTRNCCVHRFGVVGLQDAGDSGVLAVKFRIIESIRLDDDGNRFAMEDLVEKETKVKIKISKEYSREFKMGERVVFNVEEMEQIFFTLYLAGQNLVNATGETMGFGNPIPHGLTLTEEESDPV